MRDETEGKYYGIGIYEYMRSEHSPVVKKKLNWWEWSLTLHVFQALDKRANWLTFVVWPPYDVRSDASVAFSP